MRRKIIGILVCMLMIATIIPATEALHIRDSDETKSTTDSIFGWTIIRGWVANMKKQGNDLYFRAVRLHYTEITGMEMSTGILRIKRIRISDMGPDRQLTFGPLGSLTWIFGLCHGGLTEL